VPEQGDLGPLRATRRYGKMASMLDDDLAIQSTSDVAAVARIHHDTVTVAYREYFPSDAAAPTIDELTSLWAERLADPTAVTMLASRAGREIGTVTVRRDPEFDGQGQLLGLHVLPDGWGRGVGGALHDAALAALARQGYPIAGLWVIAANSRARTMYESRGWILVPELELDFLGVREIRYARRLSPPSPRPEHEPESSGI
jgi:GNAT superfamily N-acetyltransferase